MNLEWIWRLTRSRTLRIEGKSTYVVIFSGCKEDTLTDICQQYEREISCTRSRRYMIDDWFSRCIMEREPRCSSGSFCPKCRPDKMLPTLGKDMAGK